MRFHPYVLKARISPVVLVVLLPLASLGLWSPLELWVKMGATAAVALALGMLSAQLGRDAGKGRERALWERWGGPPTAQLLRHRDPTLGAEQRARAHDSFRFLRPDVWVPTAAEEAADPARCDKVYDGLIEYLIGRVRDQSEEFPLVDKENANYGFRRNLWGLKRYGIAASTLSAATAFARCYLYQDATEAPTLILFSGLALAFWIGVVRPGWVRTPMASYGRALLQALESLRIAKEEKEEGTK